MKCTECGNAMTKAIGDHHYTESGLDNVMLRGVSKYECPSCGSKRVAIPAISQLHRAIALALAQKPARLVSAEVAFLRDYLDLSNRDFADLMGVTPEHTSRWASSAEISGPAERFLRTLAVLGPEVIAKRVRETLGAPPPIDVDAVAKMLEAMPSKDAPAKKVPIDLRPTGRTGWKSAAAAPS
jgi:putative zinc finger/helix-turn-helix YgiT family protein